MSRTPLKQLSLAVLTAMIALSSHNAAAQPLSENVVHLPATAIFATENKGRFAVFTDTGRFIIQGTLYDVWDQKEINTVEDARWAATHIPVHKADVRFDDLGPLAIGSGDKVVYLFSDIQCGHCKELTDQARANLPADYRMEVILLPLLGPESTVRTAELLCAQDRARAWKAAMSGDMTTKLDPMPGDQCDGEILQKRMVTAQFLGARTVPFMIRDDGLVQQGVPAQGFLHWLQANRQGEK